MTSFKDIRELLVGVVDRQGEIVGNAKLADGYLELTRVALKGIIDARSFRLYDEVQATVPSLGKAALLNINLALDLAQPSLQKANTSQTILQGVFGVDGDGSGARAKAHAQTQIENIGVFQGHASKLAPAIEQLPGNAPLEEFERIYGMVASCNESVDHVTPTALEIYGNIKDVVEKWNMEPIDAPWTGQ